MSNANKETGMEPMNRPNCERIASDNYPHTRNDYENCVRELHRAVAALERKAAPVPAPASPRAFVVGDVVLTDARDEFRISDMDGDRYWLGGRTRADGIAYRWPASRLTLIEPAAPAAAPAEVDLVERKAASVPAPAPRGFEIGDRVRITEAYQCSSEWIGCEGTITMRRRNNDGLGGWEVGRLTKHTHLGSVPMFDRNLTLVQAAPAAAPAEVDLVERLAKVGNEAGQPGKKWPEDFGPDWAKEACAVGIRAVLSALRAENRLVEPGEIAALRAERDRAEEAQRLRDAAISVCATSNTRESATRHRLDSSNPNWSHGYERVYEAVQREMGHRERAEKAEAERDRARAALATEEAAHKEDHRVLDGRVQRAEEEVRAWRARGQEAEADRDAAFSKETALRRDLLAWKDAAHEAARAQDEFKRRLAEAEEALDAERKAHTVTCATLTKAVEEREVFRAELADATKSRLEMLDTIAKVTDANAELRRENRTLKDADALKAKRTRRTRAVTAEDVKAFYGRPGDALPAMRKLGFRRVVR